MAGKIMTDGELCRFFFFNFQNYLSGQWSYADSKLGRFE